MGKLSGSEIAAKAANSGGASQPKKSSDLRRNPVKIREKFISLAKTYENCAEVRRPGDLPKIVCLFQSILLDIGSVLYYNRRRQNRLVHFLSAFNDNEQREDSEQIF